VIDHLQHYRDYDPEKQTDLSRVAGWVNKELSQRDAFILNKLRNRLFDTSRRNRLLYYKSNMRFVNLTVSSVPVVLHYQSIRPEHLFTWNEELAEKVRGMKEIVLNKYLRFDDHAYLPSSLDRVRVESQRAIQEYGFNQLKLVIAFLNWHNLKEDPNERIQSPLLLLPVSPWRCSSSRTVLLLPVSRRRRSSCRRRAVASRAAVCCCPHWRRHRRRCAACRVAVGQLRVVQWCAAAHTAAAAAVLIVSSLCGCHRRGGCHWVVPAHTI